MLNKNKINDNDNKNNINHDNDTDVVRILITSKIIFFKNTIQSTFIHVQKSKSCDIIMINDVNFCVEKLNELNKKIKEIEEQLLLNINNELIAKQLQIINNDFSSLFKLYGTLNLEDLLIICLGDIKKNIHDNDDILKLNLLKKYFHPTGYKIIGKNITMVENKKDKKKLPYHNLFKNLLCSDISLEYDKFYMKVYGIKLFVTSNDNNDNNNIIIYGFLDDILIELLNDEYISKKKQLINNNLPQQQEFQNEYFNKFISSLSLKDYLICDNHDIYSKFSGYCSLNNNIKQKPISTIVKEFINDDIYNKRNTIISLLINKSNRENQYLAYLLYDLLSNDSNGSIDTLEQLILFDSFTWSIKQEFKQAMKKTVQYTNELSNYDFNKIPLEQQICLMNVNNSVKEKAMLKFKEVKAKSEDSGTKARQYLDGLLKIPFEIYKREPILHTMDEVKLKFKNISSNFKINEFVEILNKEFYTNIEILKYTNLIKNHIYKENNILKTNILKNKEKILKNILLNYKKKITENTIIINDILKKNTLMDYIIDYKDKNKNILKEDISNLFDILYNSEENKNVFIEIFSLFIESKIKNNNIHKISSEIITIDENIKKIKDYMIDVKNTLDKCVYGHNNAKKHIERIIGQWINGNSSSNESCIIGFEGNPGIGKTTLAKGLADCLKDADGNSRPFSLIAIGGDSNASSLIGHSYTYVGSTWGQIVQILMDKKCMNPIILIDEVDKISKTEHGKEISGVLTHLLDPSQNKQFQDKYFSGIDLDLSKVLFILSYNDPQLIDRILLDRVHRIKFDTLSVEDKIIICNKHLLPELYKKIGLENMIVFSDDVLKFIIEEYTLEPGVRKLKEKLFEIIGEFNLNVLKNAIVYTEFPIKITIEDIKNNYFKDKHEIKIQKIHTESKVGVINALWANEMSQGGILPLQVSFIPSNKFLDLTLTGSLGEVMKESISVSLTNAWNLTSDERKKEIISIYNNVSKNEVYGLHIHCPSISIKKDGPSATTAFTVIIYSLFNNKKIKNYFGITGETSFDYCLTEIGSLKEKIIHSIPAGIKEFIYPYENQRDFDKIIEKYKDSELIKGIKFHSIKNIHQVFDLILEKD